MLCHLGKSPSVRRAIEEEERKEESEREKAAFWKQEVAEWYEYFGGQIPLSREEAHPKHREFVRKIRQLKRNYRFGRLSRKEGDKIYESASSELDSSGGASYFYYEALDKAEEHEKRPIAPEPS